MSTKNKLPKVKKTGNLLAKVVQEGKELAFSERMSDVVASHFGVPAKHKQGFQLAYTLLPLNRAKECIDIAYYLSTNGGRADDIKPWLERYETLAKTELPRWAKKNSSDYLIQAYRAIEEESNLTYILHEFKGFIYAVFCRMLMERYDARK